MALTDVLALKHNSQLATITQQILNVGSVTVVTEVFTATASQTVFDLTGGAIYDTAKPAFVFVGGAIQTAPANFAKTSTTRFTMSAGVNEGTAVVFIGFKMTDYPGNNIIAVTGDKTLALTDALTYQNCTAAATITVPPNASVAFPIGTEIVFFKNTTGEVALVAGSGVTIVSESSKLKINTQSTSVYLKKVAMNTWHLFGSLKV